MTNNSSLLFRSSSSVLVESQRHFDCYFRYSSRQIDIESIYRQSNPPALSLRSSPKNVLGKMGQYDIIQKLGKGGMGETLLVYDPVCKRYLVVKQIKKKFKKSTRLHKHFLKEMQIAGRLNYAGIVPIYSVHSTPEDIYYTMPYIDGISLCDFIIYSKKMALKCPESFEDDFPIISITQFFLKICQSVFYAHQKSVLHRDLKPNNILIHRNSDIFVFDWGIAKLIEQCNNSITDIPEKIPLMGTPSYMAPELFSGSPASISTDIYSLGIILYQLLFFHLPFERKGTLKEIKHAICCEKLTFPRQLISLRKIPPMLLTLLSKCLHPQPNERFSSIAEIINELKTYTQGISQWFPTATLSFETKSHWFLKENILPIYIQFFSDNTSHWLYSRLSKTTFGINTMVDLSIKIFDQNAGIGVGLQSCEEREMTLFQDTFSAWLGTKQQPGLWLYLGHLCVKKIPRFFLQPNQWTQIRLEEINGHCYFYIDNALIFYYINPLPPPQSRLKILYRDDHFTIKKIVIHQCSYALMNHCLHIPHTFFAHQHYQQAFCEYQKIIHSFRGRDESRNAMFYAGIALLKSAQKTKNRLKKEKTLEKAFDQFEQLKDNRGEVLALLGKALVYREHSEYEEEAKSIAIAYLRYPSHPLLSFVDAYVIHRFYNMPKKIRLIHYHFAIIIIQNMARFNKTTGIKSYLQQFFNANIPCLAARLPSSLQIKRNRQQWINHLSFYLNSDKIILHHTSQTKQFAFFADSLFILLQMGSRKSALLLLQQGLKKKSLQPAAFILKAMEKIVQNRAMPSFQETNSLFSALLDFPLPPFFLYRLISFLMGYNLIISAQREETLLKSLIKYFPEWAEQYREELDLWRIWAKLQHNKMEEANALLQHYPIQKRGARHSFFYFFHGCYLSQDENFNEKKFFFQGPSSMFLSWYNVAIQYFNHPIATQPQHYWWKSFSTVWEQQQLFLQLILFFHCSGNKKKQAEYQQRLLPSPIIPAVYFKKA